MLQICYGLNSRQVRVQKSLLGPYDHAVVPLTDNMECEGESDTLPDLGNWGLLSHRQLVFMLSHGDIARFRDPIRRIDLLVNISDDSLLFLAELSFGLARALNSVALSDIHDRRGVYTNKSHTTILPR